jgi:hypothetical protein
MTAEIAIVNRSALALAADSAVTIRIGGKYKIYDSAEKIFELTRQQPIALTLYNNVEFVNIPLDVLVRRFRNENRKKFPRIRDAAAAFLDYLRGFPRDVEDEKIHLFQLILPKFSVVITRFTKVAQEAVRQMLSGEAPAGDPKQTLIDLIQAEIDAENAAALPGFLARRTLKSFLRRYQDVIDTAIKKASLGVIDDPDVGTKFREYAFALVRSKNKSPVFTGMVFGGFGNRDLFPTLNYCEVDGVYFDELKFISGTELDIDRRGHSAGILPFAQQEMAERFISGLDSRLEQDLKKFIKESAKNIVSVKPGSFTDAEKNAVVQSVSSEFEKTLNKLKGRAANSILSIVNFMSKKELADMAHALVELTSKKRKFSAQEETVGGPIDVAIITKNEGLIWIQRKHYFNTELNQYYITRIREQPKGNGGRRNVQSAKAKRSSVASKRAKKQ